MEEFEKNVIVITLLENNNPLFVLTFDKHREVTNEQIRSGVKRFYKRMAFDVEVELTKPFAHYTDITVKNYPKQGEILKLDWTLISNVPV